MEQIKSLVIKVFVAGNITGLKLAPMKLPLFKVPVPGLPKEIDKYSIGFGQWKLSNSFDEFVGAIPDEKLYFEELGTVHKSVLKSSDAIFFGTIDVTLELKGNEHLLSEALELTDDKYLQYAALNAMSMFQNVTKYYLHSLWYFKDCCVTLDLSSAQIFNKPDVVMFGVNSDIYKSDGNSDQFVVNKIIIQSWNSFLDSNDNYLQSDYLADNLYGFKIVKDKKYNTPKATKSNRVERAMVFIFDARSTKDLPKKISMYVAALECLFTTGNDEISHKVAERCASYIESTPESKLLVFKDVKAAYSVRSSYMHGSQIKQNNDLLIEISCKTDQILRSVLNKILINHVEYFREPRGKNNDRIYDLDSLFDKLVMGISW